MNIVTETLVNGALGASGVVAWRWDIENSRIEWSPAAEEVIGLPDIVLRSPELLTRAIHPDDLPLVSHAYSDALRRGTPMQARFRLTASSGVRWLDCAGRPILDDSGKAIGATGTLVDVTEECEAEEAMLQTMHDAEVVLGEIGARVWEWDPETDVLEYLSPPTGPAILAEEAIDGVKLSVALGRISDEDAAMVRQKVEHTLATGEPISFETTAIDDAGAPHRVFVRGSISPHSPGRLTGVSIILD